MPKWRPVLGFEGRYEVSDAGQVRSLISGQVLKGSFDGNFYLAVGLHAASRQTTRRIHSLVLEAFRGPRPAGQVARHLNGDPFDNRLVNLCYGTLSENSRDRVRHGNDYNARKTCCAHGHTFDAANTYIRPNGARDCQACKRAARVRYRQRSQFA